MKNHIVSHLAVGFAAAAIAFMAGWHFAAEGAKSRKPEFQAREARGGAGREANFLPLGPKGKLLRSPGSEFPGSELPDESDARYGVTLDDKNRTSELGARRHSGEYVLKWEWPILRKVRDQTFSNMVEMTASKSAAELDGVYSALGVSGGAAEQLKTHRSKIHRASLETSAAIKQLEHARQEYDTRMKELLPEDKYLAYRDYEDGRQAARETQRIQQFIREASLPPLEEKYADLLVELVRESGSYSEPYWHGPYDGLPSPKVGAAQVVDYLNEQAGEMQKNSDELLRRSRAAGLPEEYQNNLSAYYSHKIAEKQQSIRSIQNRNSVPFGAAGAGQRRAGDSRR